MLEKTKNRFKERLEKDICRLCKASDSLSYDNDKIELVFEYYRRYRKIIHDRIEEGDAETPLRMDRHKIASAFFCAIVKANPINRKPDAAKFLERTVNIQLALLFSTMCVIDFFNVSDKNNTETDKKVYSRIFKLPRCKQSKSKEYITNFVMLVEDIQIRNLDLDSDNFESNLLFVISHIFFLIDVYSYQENFCITLQSETPQNAP